MRDLERVVKNSIILLEQSPMKCEGIKFIIDINKLRELINKTYKEMDMEYGIKHTIELEEMYKLDGEITDEGIIMNSYNSDSDVEETEGFVSCNPIIYLGSNIDNERILSKSCELMILKGFDGNTYWVNCEYYCLKNTIYGVLPNYRVNNDGSISSIPGSGLENLKRIKCKNLLERFMLNKAIRISWNNTGVNSNLI